MGTNFAVAPGEYLQEWIDGNGMSVGEFAVDLASLPPAAAAFIGALTAGILASVLKSKIGYPRISLTVPSIVIMVPGLYLYRAIYNLGVMSLQTSASWFAAAILIILALQEF